VRKWIMKRVERRRNVHRAQGALLASTLLRQVGEDQGVESPVRAGMLLAAGFSSVLSTCLRTGENEIGLVDVDGETVPVDLTIRGLG
jgi:hypothetical protein